MEQGAVIERPAGGDVPVAALPYRLETESGSTVEVKFAVAATMALAVLALVTLCTTIWISLYPEFFRTVGAFRNVWSGEFALLVVQTLLHAVLLAGGIAFFMRRPVCRPLLLGGAGGVVLLQLFIYVYYLMRQPGTAIQQQTTADRVVMAVWSGRTCFENLVAPLLVLLMMNRPHVKAQFQRGGGGA